VYNLGVMEHFTHDQIATIFKEFHRVIKPGGKIVLFWPHARSTSVLTFHILHFMLNKVMKKMKKLHPAEITLMQSKKFASNILSDSDFSLTDYQFGIGDFFVQAVIVAVKNTATK
ncbi:MAG: class I SAM-dependent methyltransferase, partial [Verrucomicrobiota bacterium]